MLLSSTNNTLVPLYTASIGDFPHRRKHADGDVSVPPSFLGRPIDLRQRCIDRKEFHAASGHGSPVAARPVRLSMSRAWIRAAIRPLPHASAPIRLTSTDDSPQSAIPDSPTFGSSSNRRLPDRQCDAAKDSSTAASPYAPASAASRGLRCRVRRAVRAGRTARASVVMRRAHPVVCFVISAVAPIAVGCSPMTAATVPRRSGLCRRLSL